MTTTTAEDLDLRKRFESKLLDGTLVSFAHGYCGAAAIARAVRESKDKPVALLVAKHPHHGGQIFNRHVIQWAKVDGRLTLRYCTANGNPHGAGSYSLAASPLTGESTPEQIRAYEDEVLALLAMAIGMERIQYQAEVFLEYRQ